MSIDISRRDLMGSFTAAAAATALAPLEAEARAASLNFLSIGDWGRNGNGHQRDVAVQMGKAAEETGARFTVSVGDNFYGSGVASVTDPQWQSSFEEVYSAGSLQHRWYAVLGNHDYKGDPQAQIDYSKVSRRWTMPGRYFMVEGSSIGAPHVDLFMIDTPPIITGYRDEPAETAQHHVHDQNPEAQIAWLDAALAKSRAPWKLVFGHHPIRTGGQHGPSKDMIAHVQPLLKQHGVQLYVCGHDHDMQHIAADGMHYILTGCGSTVRPVTTVEGTRFALSQSGFSLFRSTPGALTVEFRDYLGATVYAATINPASGDML
ncbi:tartrate-resistant acid phosphatase type 5 family protein [Sphingobium aquiterrae]|uniref:purple acid phosphatase family protein n=1 Tax=Sphingobium aquiterrae TaxID=2038656 RepID=UPI00301792B1